MKREVDGGKWEVDGKITVKVASLDDKETKFGS